MVGQTALKREGEPTDAIVLIHLSGGDIAIA